MYSIVVGCDLYCFKSKIRNFTEELFCDFFAYTNMESSLDELSDYLGNLSGLKENAYTHPSSPNRILNLKLNSHRNILSWKNPIYTDKDYHKNTSSDIAYFIAYSLVKFEKKWNFFND